jgi:hypothetical protein
MESARMALASWRRVGLLKSDESYRNATIVDRVFSNAARVIANLQSAAHVNLSADRMRSDADGFHACANPCVRATHSMTTFTYCLSQMRLQSWFVKDHGPDAQATE